jgi:16S rRNA C1402 (ribose-2'-O) methylase RsmI
MMRAALQRLSLKDAVAEVTEQTGWKKRNIYQLGLKLSK